MVRPRFALRGWWLDGAALGLLLGAGAWLYGWLLKGSLYLYGDNPGQFARLWFGTRAGVLGWVPDWYAGYPELLFYPPGFVLVGRVVAALHPGGLESDFNALLWVAALLPAFGCYGFCRHALRPDGASLAAQVPGVVTGLAAGALALLFPTQWGGIHAIAIGLTAERLAFGLVPWLLWAGWGVVEQPRPWRVALAAALLALLALTHPFHAPAPVLAWVLYALARRGGRRVWGALGATLALAVALVAWWLLPLLRYADFAAPLVRATLPETLSWLRAQPAALFWLGAGVALLALSGAGWARRAGATAWALGGLAVALPLGIWLNHVVLLQRLGVDLFDPVRFAAEYYLALLLLTSLAVAGLLAPGAARWARDAGLVALMVVGLAGWDSWQQIRGGRVAGEERFLASVEARPELAGLWDELARGEGRVLYTSSYLRLPLAGGGTLPTALKTLTGYRSGREQVGGTFSHWSPVARLLWVGDAQAAVLPERVETEDDRTFLGMAWESMDDDRFGEVARALNVGTVVTSVEDFQARTFLDRSAHWQSFWNNGFFFLYRPVEPSRGWAWIEGGTARVTRRTETEWQIEVAEPGDGRLHLSQSYFPTWQPAAEDGQPLSLQRDAFGLTVVDLNGARAVTLRWALPQPGGWLRVPTLALTATLAFVAAWDGLRARKGR